jgi:hypothetical protein
MSSWRGRRDFALRNIALSTHAKTIGPQAYSKRVNNGNALVVVGGYTCILKNKDILREPRGRRELIGGWI